MGAPMAEIKRNGAGSRTIIETGPPDAPKILWAPLWPRGGPTILRAYGSLEQSYPPE